ncbi:MAG: TetR/AcrR family transcriptional regulator, partial [Hyphomicrobiales bacterium]
RLLLRDGPSVLGHAEMDRIDRLTGAGELRQGLASAMADTSSGDVPLEALTELVSAAFDRAALAIAEGRPADDYKAAIRLILSGLTGKA